MSPWCRIASLVSSSVILTACSVAHTQQDLDAYRTAKPCCASEQALPAAVAVAPVNELKFNPASPHFDFGFGLAPFARLRIDPATAKYVSLLAYPASSGKLLGGDGSFHYADLRIVFYDGSGHRLQAMELSPPEIRMYGLAGTYMLARSVAVPESAVTATVTTNPADAGKRGSSTVQVAGGGTMIKGVFIALPAGSPSYAYTLSMYGEAVVRTSETPPRF